jgi:hypothetical protein
MAAGCGGTQLFTSWQLREREREKHRNEGKKGREEGRKERKKERRKEGRRKEGRRKEGQKEGWTDRRKEGQKKGRTEDIRYPKIYFKGTTFETYVLQSGPTSLSFHHLPKNSTAIWGPNLPHMNLFGTPILPDLMITHLRPLRGHLKKKKVVSTPCFPPSFLPCFLLT